MANPVPSDKLVDLQQNAQTTDEVVNSSALTTTARPTPTDPTGKVIKTLAGISADVALALERIGVQYSDPIADWTALTEITAFEAHRYPATTGDLYIPTASLPFTTGATFDSDNWTLLQGATTNYVDTTVPQNIINDPSQPYIFDSFADMVASTIEFPVGKMLFIRGYATSTDNLGCWWRVQSSSSVIDNESFTDIDYTDERSIKLSNGNFIVFHDSLNNGMIKNLETNNYANLQAKVYSRNATVTINAYGDSLTFGQALPDTVGATNKIGVATNFGDGSVHNHWQYDANWLVELKVMMDLAFKTPVAINNRGYSGDRAGNNYIRQRNVPDSGVSIIAFGTNEVLNASLNGSSSDGILTNTGDGVEAYTQAVRRYIIREVLRGNTIVLLGTPFFINANGWDGTGYSATKLTDAYDKAAKALADEFGLLYVDTKQDLLRGYSLLGSQGFVQDGIHYNGIGHKIIGAKMGGMLLGGHKNIMRLQAGDSVLASQVRDMAMKGGNDGIHWLPNATSYTSPLETQPVTTDTQATLPIVWSFYVEQDNTIIYPEISVSNTTFFVKLDNGARQPEYLMDVPIGKPLDYDTPTAYPASIKGKTVVGTSRYSQSNQDANIEDNVFIHVASKGYHTILIENVNASGLLVDGLTTLPWEAAKNKIGDIQLKVDGKEASKDGSDNLPILNSKNADGVLVRWLQTGLYDVYFSPDRQAPDVNYFVSAFAMGQTLGSVNHAVCAVPPGQSAELTTSKVRIECKNPNGVAIDAEFLWVNVDFGL
jgi:hypothetical protein